MDPYTPEWWLQRLNRKLSERQTEIRKYDEYYEGIHPLGFATPKYREAFGNLFRSFADNWCDLVVDAVEERLNVEGFRYGEERESDKQAWRIWQANQLDSLSQIAHTESLVNSVSYALVWYDTADAKTPTITIEHPSEVIVEDSPGTRQRLAALKRWLEIDGYLYATLYLPDGVYKFRSSQQFKVETQQVENVQWVVFDIPTEMWPLPNPLGVVPVVPLYNRPRLLHSGVSEIAKIIPLQDAVNKLVTDMLVAAEFGAAPQRWATGLEIPTDPTTGRPVQAFEHMIDRLWVSGNESTQFGQFSQLDLSVFVNGIEMLVQHIASQTRTPPHYFYLSGQFPSGESIKSAETGLAAKTRRKQRHYGEAWEEVMRLAFGFIGQKRRAEVMSAETIWGDAESRSESEHIDAVMKRRALNVPLRQLWEDAGYTPQQIERFVEMLEEEKRLGLDTVSPQREVGAIAEGSRDG